jgi:hypothetical protein
MNITANLACHRERYSRLAADPLVRPLMSPVWWRAPTTHYSSCSCYPGSVGPSTILHASSSVADVVPIFPVHDCHTLFVAARHLSTHEVALDKEMVEYRST